MKTSFTLLVISAEQDIPHEAETVNELFRSGLATFYLRKPGWSIEQEESFLKNVEDKFHPKIVLHSHFGLMDKFNLKGIHLNEENKKEIDSFKHHKIISASFHSIQDINDNVFPYQYVFLSPIFNSISKPGYTSKFDLKLLPKEIKALKQNNPNLSKIIALGGIASDNIENLITAGFDGAALLGSVWESKHPVESFLQLKSASKLN